MKIQIKIGRRITFPARLEVNYFYFIFAYIFNMQNKKNFVTLFFDFFSKLFFRNNLRKNLTDRFTDYQVCKRVSLSLGFVNHYQVITAEIIDKTCGRPY